MLASHLVQLGELVAASVQPSSQQILPKMLAECYGSATHDGAWQDAVALRGAVIRLLWMVAKSNLRITGIMIPL